MSFHAKDFAGSHCGCRYQQDYRPTLGRDGKKESGTLEVIKFYYDGAIRFEQHCYGEAATFVFGVWASGMDEDGTLHWVLPDRRKSYYDEAYLPKKLDRVGQELADVEALTNQELLANVLIGHIDQFALREQGLQSAFLGKLLVARGMNTAMECLNFHVHLSLFTENFHGNAQRA